MRLTLVIDVSPSDDVADDADAREEFKRALVETFEENFSADPTEVYECGDGEFSYEIVQSNVTVSDVEEVVEL